MAIERLAPEGRWLSEFNWTCGCPGSLGDMNTKHARACSTCGYLRPGTPIEDKADVIEACAKVCDAYAEHAEELKRSLGDRRDWDGTTEAEGRASAARHLAAEIRKLR